MGLCAMVSCGWKATQIHNNTHIYEHQNLDHGSAREERILLRAGLRHRCSPMGLTATSSSSSQEGLTPPSSPHGDAPARASIHDPIPPLSLYIPKKQTLPLDQPAQSHTAVTCNSCRPSCASRGFFSTEWGGELCCLRGCEARAPSSPREPAAQSRLTIRVSDK